MRVINHNWSAIKQHFHPQSVAEISRHSVLSGDRIRQCGTSSGSRHKDTDQCLSVAISFCRHRSVPVPCENGSVETNVDTMPVFHTHQHDCPRIMLQKSHYSGFLRTRVVSGIHRHIVPGIHQVKATEILNTIISIIFSLVYTDNPAVNQQKPSSNTQVCAIYSYLKPHDVSAPFARISSKMNSSHYTNKCTK